jgi:hypothetical protein
VAAITWTDVTNVAPELSTIASTVQTALLLLVNDYLDPDTWGGEDSQKLLSGRAYLAAHLATLGKRKGVNGQLTAEAGGGLSRSYGMLTNPTMYSMTTYGEIFAMLAKTTVARVGFSLAAGAQVPSDPGWDG